jgi:protein-disulfide isomerase
MAKDKSGMQDKLLPVMIVALIAAAFFLGNLWGKVQVYEGGNGSTTQTAGTPTQPAPEPTGPLSEDLWNEILSDQAFAYGEENAPVTMVEFTDYQCPFCKRHFDETADQITQNYIDTGKVRYIIRDLPLSFHPNAKPAALAARCAGDQDKYLEMHDLLFEDQDAWASLTDASDIFKGYAGDLGLSQATFNTCYDNDTYGDVIDQDIALAGKVAATGTPTFFINGVKLVGAQPFAAFQAALDAEL